MGQPYSFAGERLRAARISVAEIDAIHGMSGGETILCVLTGCGHEHRVAAAIDANLDRIDAELGHELLKIGKNAGGKRFAVGLVEEGVALIFAQRRVERKNVVFLLVAGLIADSPVRDDEIS